MHTPFTLKEKYPHKVQIISPVGTSFRPAETFDKLEEGDIAKFVPEPENKFDSNAIKMVVFKNGEELHVGYVPKDQTSTVDPEKWEARIFAIYVKTANTSPGLRAELQFA